VIVVILDYLIHLISVLRYVRSSQKWMVCKAHFKFMCFVRVEIVNGLFDPVFQLSSIGMINMSFMHSTSVHTCTVFVPSVSMCVYVSNADGPLQQQLHPLWATLNNGHFSVNCIPLVY